MTTRDQDLPSERRGASRRELLVGGAGVAALAALGGAAAAQDAPTGGNADFLFVQTAKGMAFDADQNRLTLRDVSPVTLFFSDRPDRIAGNMETARFVPFWSEGKDSFLSDPPNADLSILEDGKLRQTVVVLRDPVTRGRRPALYGADPERRHAGARRARVALHRRRRDAAHAGLRRRSRPPRLPARRDLLRPAWR